MATLTIGITGSGVANGTRTFTPSDPDIAALIAWFRASRPETPDARTDAQILGLWADSLVNEMKKSIRRRQQDSAGKTATDAIPGPAFPPV